MHAGELRTKIEIHALTASGTGGFKTSTYTKVLATRCKWVNAHGKDASIADANQVELRATVTMRDNPLIVESCRVKMGGRMYSIITGIDHIRERGQWIEFQVRAVVVA